MSQPTNNSEKPSAYINIAATVNPAFTCCLSSITNRNIANNTPTTPRSRKVSFENEEASIDTEPVDIIVERD